MTAFEGRARLGPAAWLKTASVAAALTMALASLGLGAGHVPLRDDRRAAASRRAGDHRDPDHAGRHAHPRDALHLQQQPRAGAAAGRERDRQRRRQDRRDHAARGRAVPQRRGDAGGRRGRLARSLGPARRPGQGALRPYRERRGDRRPRGHDHVQGRVRAVEEPACLQQWRGGDHAGRRSSVRRPPSRWRPSRSSAPARSASANGGRTATSRCCGSTTMRSRPARPTAMPARGTSPWMRSTSSRCPTSAPG